MILALRNFELKWKVSFAILLILRVHLFSQNVYTFPETRKVNQIDTIWGRSVYDPYRWFENTKSSETLEWLKTQKKLADTFIGSVSKNLEDYLTHYYSIDFKRVHKEGKYIFSYMYEDKDQTASLYYRTWDREPSFLFDPNKLSKTDKIDIADISISGNNNTLALTLEKMEAIGKQSDF